MRCYINAAIITPDDILKDKTVIAKDGKIIDIINDIPDNCTEIID